MHCSGMVAASTLWQCANSAESDSTIELMWAHNSSCSCAICIDRFCRAYKWAASNKWVHCSCAVGISTWLFPATSQLCATSMSIVLQTQAHASEHANTNAHPCLALLPQVGKDAQGHQRRFHPSFAGAPCLVNLGEMQLSGLPAAFMEAE